MKRRMVLKMKPKKPRCDASARSLNAMMLERYARKEGLSCKEDVVCRPYKDLAAGLR